MIIFPCLSFLFFPFWLKIVSCFLFSKLERFLFYEALVNSGVVFYLGSPARKKPLVPFSHFVIKRNELEVQYCCWYHAFYGNRAQFLRQEKFMFQLFGFTKIDVRWKKNINYLCCAEQNKFLTVQQLYSMQVKGEKWKKLACNPYTLSF